MRWHLEGSPIRKRGARDIWSMYQTLKYPEIVARGIALGAISDDALSAELRDKIKPLSHRFREARKGAVYAV